MVEKQAQTMHNHRENEKEVRKCPFHTLLFAAVLISEGGSHLDLIFPEINTNKQVTQEASIFTWLMHTSARSKADSWRDHRRMPVCVYSHRSPFATGSRIGNRR